MTSYDLIVIGSGPAGRRASILTPSKSTNLKEIS